MRIDSVESETGGGSMKYSIYNGKYVGTAEWSGPGDVTLDVDDARERSWLQRYFSREDCFLCGPVESAEMTVERGDASAEAFERATYRLSAFAYRVRAHDPQGAAT
jgi:hypothetical protein